MLMLVNHTTGRTICSPDAVWIGHLWLLWVIWGHVVTLMRLADPDPYSRLPTVPVPAPDGPAASPTRPVI